MSILRDDEPVTRVLLGEELILRWTAIPNPEFADVDYFIRNCSAERMGGAPPHPTPVRLITDGYNCAQHSKNTSCS